MSVFVHDNSTSMVVHLSPVIDLSDDQLYEFSRINRDLRIERNAQGEVTIMSPTGGETGNRNAEIGLQLRLWAKSDGTGTTFDSSTGFRLPNGAVRSPDAAWISYARLNTLTNEQREKFIPLCPDFVVELLSPTDILNEVRAKMQEYIENGARLGFLIDRAERRVYIYRPDTPVDERIEPSTVSGDPVLPGFELSMAEIW